MLSISKEKFILALAKSMLNDDELATLSKVSRSVISSIKTGKRSSVRPQVIGKLANALKVEVEDLI